VKHYQAANMLVWSRMRLGESASLLKAEPEFLLLLFFPYFLWWVGRGF
jgi:hypothetical protein